MTQSETPTPPSEPDKTLEEAAPADASNTVEASDETSQNAGVPEVVDETPLTPEQEVARDKIVEILKDVYDPEIPVSIHALGMIYNVDVQQLPEALITMTLTSPACPVAGTLPGEVEVRIQELDCVDVAKVNLVWEPPWSPDMMSEAAKLQLNMY